MRQEYRIKIESYKNQKKPIVYIDESGFSHSSIRTHGYAQKGKRCYDSHNWGEKGRTNAIGALLGNRLITVDLFDTSINKNTFIAWLEQSLIPSLSDKSVIVMDNASFHKGQEIKKLILDAGHILEYLPTYSPDLNPIEHKWSQAKSIRRKYNCSINSLFKYYLI